MVRTRLNTRTALVPPVDYEPKEQYRVLVINSRIPVCKQVDNFLSKEGHRVTTAKTSLDVSNYMRKFGAVGKFVIVSDLQFFNFSLVDFIKKIKVTVPNVKVIVYTGSENTPRKEEVKAAGISGWISNPSDFQSFISNFNRILNIK